MEFLFSIMEGLQIFVPVYVQVVHEIFIGLAGTADKVV
jgi:hypothetical protein